MSSTKTVLRKKKNKIKTIFFKWLGYTTNFRIQTQFWISHPVSPKNPYPFFSGTPCMLSVLIEQTDHYAINILSRLFSDFIDFFF